MLEARLYVNGESIGWLKIVNETGVSEDLATYRWRLRDNAAGGTTLSGEHVPHRRSLGAWRLVETVLAAIREQDEL